MPPILYVRAKKFSNKIITYDNVSSNNNNKDDDTKKIRNRGITPVPVDTIPTITISPGPVSFTLVTSVATPTSVPTSTSTSISASETLESTPNTISISSPSSPTTLLPTSSNGPSNNLPKWLLPTLVVSLFVMMSTIIAFIIIIKKRSRKNNNIKNIGSEDIMDKMDNSKNSKSNSLTSSINSISSSFRMKKGKVAPEDINISSSSPPVPVPIISDNNNNNNEEGEAGEDKMPTLKRTQTTVSAFKEMVDLTDEENEKLKKSINSGGIHAIASHFGNVEEGASRNVIPLHQERIDVETPFNFSAGASTSENGSGIRTATSPFSDGEDDDNDQK